MKIAIPLQMFLLILFPSPSFLSSPLPYESPLSPFPFLSSCPQPNIAKPLLDRQFEI